MSDDMLSQDQIDALLNSNAEDGADGREDVQDELQQETRDYGALRAALEFFNEQAAGVIGVVLNRQMTLQVEECAAAAENPLRDAVSPPLLIATLPFESGLDGSLYMVLSKAVTARLADLMLMGDGTAEYSEDHIDAISELYNQVIGTYSNAMGEKVGETVSSGSVQVSEFDFSNPPFSLDNADMAVVRLGIEDLNEERIGFIIPEALSTQLIALYSGDSGAHGGGGEGDGVGLNGAELDDLSRVTDFGGDGFSESPLSAETMSSGGNRENIDMLLDVEMDVSIELGRADLSIKRILEMAPGSIVELDRLAGEPVDLLVNDKVVAKGEVVVVDENFGIRIVSLVSPEERIRSLR